MISEFTSVSCLGFCAMYQYRVLSAFDGPKTSMLRTNVFYVKTKDAYHAHIPGNITFSIDTGEVRSAFAVLGAGFLEKEYICLRYLFGCHQWPLETLYLGCLPFGDYKRYRFSFIKVINLCKKYIVDHEHIYENRVSQSLSNTEKCI